MLKRLSSALNTHSTGGKNTGRTPPHASALSPTVSGATPKRRRAAVAAKSRMKPEPLSELDSEKENATPDEAPSDIDEAEEDEDAESKTPVPKKEPRTKRKKVKTEAVPVAVKREKSRRLCAHEDCTAPSQKTWMKGGFCTLHGPRLCDSELCSQRFDLSLSSPLPHLCVQCRDPELREIPSWGGIGLRITLPETASTNGSYLPHQLHRPGVAQRATSGRDMIRAEIRRRGYRQTVPLPVKVDLPKAATKRHSTALTPQEIEARQIAAISHRVTELDAERARKLPDLPPLPAFTDPSLSKHEEPLDYHMPSYAYELRTDRFLPVTQTPPTPKPASVLPLPLPPPPPQRALGYEDYAKLSAMLRISVDPRSDPPPPPPPPQPAPVDYSFLSTTLTRALAIARDLNAQLPAPKRHVVLTRDLNAQHPVLKRPFTRSL